MCIYQTPISAYQKAMYPCLKKKKKKEKGDRERCISRCHYFQQHQMLWKSMLRWGYFFRLHIGDRAHLYNKHLSQRAFHTRELRRKVIMKHTSTTSKHNKQDSFHRWSSLLHLNEHHQWRISSVLSGSWWRKAKPVFHIVKFSLFLKQSKILMITVTILNLINIKFSTCASNSAILWREACSMQARRFCSSSSKVFIWYLNSAISWVRSSASSFAFNFSSLNSS